MLVRFQVCILYEYYVKPVFEGLIGKQHLYTYLTLQDKSPDKIIN